MHLIHTRSLFKTSMKSALFLAQIPCCSSIPFPAMELHTSCSFALNPILKNNNNPCSSQSQMQYSSNSSSKGHSATDNSYEKPHMYQLEHIQKRLEFTVPLMFKMKLDYTFYRKDVILEDQIFKTTKCGLHNMMNHMATISFFVNITRPYVEAEILNIVPILEDGTVRLRWRIKYLTWLQTLNPANYNKERVKENVKWYDGYSIFYVDGEGLVYKWTLQKTMPDESSLQQMKDKTKEFVRRVVLPVPEQTANFAQINEESDDSIKYFKKRSSLTEKRMENNMATNIKLRKMHNY